MNHHQPKKWASVISRRKSGARHSLEIEANAEKEKGGCMRAKLKVDELIPEYYGLLCVELTMVTDPTIGHTL